jgi:hypothetical protein
MMYHHLKKRKKRMSLTWAEMLLNDWVHQMDLMHLILLILHSITWMAAGHRVIVTTSPPVA